MRILQATHHFLPRHGAGVEVYTDRVARALAARGHEVAVVTSDDDPARTPWSLRTSEARGLPLFEIAHPRLVRSPEDTLGLPEVTARFAEVLDRFRPDVVHFQHLMYLGLPVARLVRERGLPAALTLHEYWLLCARGGQMRRADGERCVAAEAETCARCLADFRFGRTAGEVRAARWADRVRRLTGWDPFPRMKAWRDRGSPSAGGPLAPWPEAPPPTILEFLKRREAAVREALEAVDALLAPSKFLREKFIDAGVAAERIRHAPYGLDPQTLRSATPDTPRPRRPLRVGFVGSIVPQKGVDVLLSAHQLLPPEQISVQVHGHVDFQPHYGARVRALARPGETRLAGGFGPGELGSVLAGIDVLVVPSVWYENAPIVISEAQAAGVPVVASRLGGMAEMVEEGLDGRLFEPGDPEDLARVLSELAQDPDQVRRLIDGIRPPRTLDDDVTSLETLYARLKRAPS